MRETQIVEQAIPERHLPHVLHGFGRNWGYRFLAGPNLGRRQLRDGPPEGAKTDEGREETRDAAARSEGRRRSYDEA